MATTDNDEDNNSKHKQGIFHVISLSTQEILYLFIIIMLGISIFFIASLIDPLHRLGDKLAENQDVAIKLAKELKAQQDIIIANEERIIQQQQQQQQNITNN
jgi:hypothetical protein